MDLFDIFLEGNFLEKILFGVVCKTIEYAIFNHKTCKFCTLFSLY